jgi:two-component system NtrC family sensor kinase
LPFVIEAAYNRYLFDSERRSKGEILSVMSEEVIKSKEQWQATIDAVTDYIFVIDRDSKIRRTNVSFATRFKRHPRDMIGMKIDTLLGIDMSYGDSPFKEVFASNTPVSRELRIGDEIFIVNIFPAMFDDDEVAVCIMKDVTETKRLREQLYHSDKLASIGLLVSGVAHEINNPLTGVLGYAEMLLSITKEDKTQKYLYKIYNAAERCKKFVETLLCFSRQQKSQHSLENINDIIDRTLEVRTYWFRSNNVEILKNYGNVPLVYIDAQQMQQVMLNILINAEQAIDSYNQCGRIVLSTAYDEKNKKSF